MKNEFVTGYDAGMGIKSIGKLAMCVDAMQVLYRNHPRHHAGHRVLHGMRTALSVRLANSF